MFSLVAIVICGLSSVVFSHQSCYSNFDYECYVLRKLVEHVDAISSIKEDLEGVVSGDTKCPDAWIPYKGSCYLFANQNMNFLDAQTYCEQAQTGAHLVHVNDWEENNFIQDMLRQLKDKNWWLGLSDREVEGSWKLVGNDTSTVYTNWSPGEPESAGGRANEDCAAFYQPLSFRWVDASCSSNFSPVCEK